MGKRNSSSLLKSDYFLVTQTFPWAYTNPSSAGCLLWNDAIRECRQPLLHCGRRGRRFLFSSCKAILAAARCRRVVLWVKVVQVVLKKQVFSRSKQKDVNFFLKNKKPYSCEGKVRGTGMFAYQISCDPSAAAACHLSCQSLLLHNLINIILIPFGNDGHLELQISAKNYLVSVSGFGSIWKKRNLIFNFKQGC